MSDDILINYKVYIAGQYAPAQEIIAQSGIFSFSEAQITLFPHEELLDFGENDRVPCQIFFLDTFIDPRQPKYVLLFEGEIVKTGYIRTSNSISMDLSCVSYFEILAQMFFTYFTDLVSTLAHDLVTIRNTNSEIGLTSLVGDGILSNYSDAAIPKMAEFKDFFSKVFLKNGKTLAGSDTIKRPFAFLRNILINLSQGVTLSEKYNDDVHLFLKTFISKKQMYNSIFASPILEKVQEGLKYTPNTILDAVEDEERTQRIITGLSRAAQKISTGVDTSFWHLIQLIYSVFMYELLMPLCPPYIKSDLYGVPSYKLHDAVKEDKKSYGGILHCLSKPEINFGVPPISNVIFPSMINTVGVMNDHFTKPTRLYVTNPTVLSKLGISSGGSNAVIEKLAQNINSVVYPPDLGTKFVTKVSANGSTKTVEEEVPFNKIRETLLWSTNLNEGNEYFKGPVTFENKNVPSWVNYIRKEASKESDTKPSDNSGRKITEKVISTGEAIDKFLEKHAANEFQKETAGRRTLTLELKFNPYLIAGFPAVVIDNIALKQYYYTMPISVVHRLSQTAASTSLQVMNTIPFKEALYTSLLGEKGAYTVGPVNPSKEIREVFNRIVDAQIYYKNVLYQGKNDSLYAFDPTDFFKMLDGDIDVSRDTNTKEYIAGIKDDKLIYFNDYKRALEFVSRPIVTLPQYLKLREEIHYMDSKGNPQSLKHTDSVLIGGVKALLGGGKMFNGEGITAAIKSRTNPNMDDAVEGAFYETILGFSTMSQFPSEPKEVNVYPDFIQNWIKKIRLYREDVLSNNDILIY